MKAAQIDVVERTTQLLAGFNLSTAAPELGPRLENAGQRDALLLVLEVLEMEAEAREQRKITRLRRAAQIPPGKTFETLDASCPLPAPLMRKLRELARGEFLEQAANALALYDEGTTVRLVFGRDRPSLALVFKTALAALVVTSKFSTGARTVAGA